MLLQMTPVKLPLFPRRSDQVPERKYKSAALHQLQTLLEYQQYITVMQGWSEGCQRRKGIFLLALFLKDLLVERSKLCPNLQGLFLGMFSMVHFCCLLQSQQNIPFAKKLESQRSGFMRAMSDSGLKPTVVYHNLTPAELYEKVRLVNSHHS